MRESVKFYLCNDAVGPAVSWWRAAELVRCLRHGCRRERRQNWVVGMMAQEPSICGRRPRESGEGFGLH